MRSLVTPTTLDELQELEREMQSQGHLSKAQALREALLALAKPARGWVTTRQAAEQLGITIPTVKAWISRGALVGRQVGDRWWVSTKSVDEVLSLGRVLAELEEEGHATEEEIYEITKRVRRHMRAEKNNQEHLQESEADGRRARKATMRRYTLLLIADPETGRYTVEVPMLPGCVTEGDTVEAAIANAREAIAAWIRSAEMDGADIPEEKVPLALVNIDVG